MQPNVAVIVGSVLRAPRRIRHDANFTHVFSPIRDEQLDYVDGLMVVSAIFLILFILWALLLVILKFKGKEVGCASGRAFVTSLPDEPSTGDDDDDDDDEGDYVDEAVSTTSSSSGSYSGKPLVSDRHADHGATTRTRKRRSRDISMDLGKDSTNPSDDDRTYGRSGSNSHDSLSESGEITEHRAEDDENGSLNTIMIHPRERRTRICFLLSASTALILVPLILVFSFGPLQEATQSSDALIVVRLGCWVQTSLLNVLMMYLPVA
jgi:hypothetical protein